MTDVIGAIRAKWLTFGGEAGFGRPLDIERPTFDGVGRTQPFANGRFIAWHPSTGAFVVWGAIAATWIAVGRERYGYPITDELVAPDGRGRFNHFRIGATSPGQPEASIYWTPTTGAHEVHGAIRTAWAKQGWERGPVRLPHQQRARGRLQRLGGATSSTASSTGRRSAGRRFTVRS